MHTGVTSEERRSSNQHAEGSVGSQVGHSRHVCGHDCCLLSRTMLQLSCTDVHRRLPSFLLMEFWQKWPYWSLHSGQLLLYFWFIAPITTSVNGPITVLAELMAKNNPSDPAGANEAAQDVCRGLHKTSPIVKNTCHMHDPVTFGDITTKIGEMAIIQSPFRMRADVKYEFETN